MNNQTKTQENVKKALAKQTLGLPLTPHAVLRWFVRGAVVAVIIQPRLPIQGLTTEFATNATGAEKFYRV